MIKIFNEYIETLSNSLLFNGIDKANLNSMLVCLQPKIHIYKRNEPIILFGDKFNYIGIMLKGEAIVTKDNAAGKRVVISKIKTGELFGGTLVFSSLHLWPFSIEAQEKCTVFLLEKGKIIGDCEKVCSWHKTLIENMLKIVSEKALKLNKRVEYMTIKSMRGKISTFLLEQFNQTKNLTFMLPMKRGELAEFFNVSRPSMSREMCRMRDEGIIDFYLSTMRIINLEALKESIE